MISAGLGPPEMAMPILLMLCLWFVGPGQHAQTLDASAGHRSAQGARASSRRAISSATASCPNGATICTPIGRPSGWGSPGTLMPDPDTEHALGRGRQAWRRLILGVPGRRGGSGEIARVVVSPHATVTSRHCQGFHLALARLSPAQRLSRSGQQISLPPVGRYLRLTIAAILSDQSPS